MTAAAIIPPITKLSKSVIRILGCNPGPMTLQGTNTYLVGSGRKRILVDAGDKDVPEYQKHLSDIIKSEGIDIEHIVITHWHRDHIGGVENLLGNIVDNPCNIKPNEFQKVYKNKNVTSNSSMSMSVHDVEKLFNDPNKPIVWKYKRDDHDEDEADADLLESVPIHWLSNRQKIEVEGATLQVHHTPGHTTDHVVLKLLEENILFSGDCILGEGTAVFEDLYMYMKSLYNILELEPSVIYPGHGNVVTDPMEKIKYYIHHRKMRETQILDMLKDNGDKCLSEMDLVKVIYVDTPAELWPAAAYTISHHLTKLSKENKIMCRNTDGGKKWQYIPYSTL